MSYRISSVVARPGFEILANMINEAYGVLITKTEIPSDFPQVKVTLANNCEVSIVSHEFSYGDTEGLFEMMVTGDDEPHAGWLNRGDVVKEIGEIMNRPRLVKSTVPEDMVTFSI